MGDNCSSLPSSCALPPTSLLGEEKTTEGASYHREPSESLCSPAVHSPHTLSCNEHIVVLSEGWGVWGSNSPGPQTANQQDYVLQPVWGTLSSQGTCRAGCCWPCTLAGFDWVTVKGGHPSIFWAAKTQPQVSLPPETHWSAPAGSRHLGKFILSLSLVQQTQQRLVGLQRQKLRRGNGRHDPFAREDRVGSLLQGAPRGVKLFPSDQTTGLAKMHTWLLRPPNSFLNTLLEKLSMPTLLCYLQTLFFWAP